MKLFAHDAETRRLLESRRQALQARHGETAVRQLEHKREGDTLELVIAGVIGDFWGDSVPALDVIRLLNSHKTAAHIRALINSPGGDVFDGLAIFNALRMHGAKIETVNMGLAASAASYIFQAGDVRTMGQGAQLMLHRAWTIALGNEQDMQATSQILRGIDSELVKLYASRSGKSEAEARAWLEGEAAADGTWFGAEAAIAAGLADGSLGDQQAQPAAQQQHHFSDFGGLRVAALLPQFGALTVTKPVSGQEAAPAAPPEQTPPAEPTPAAPAEGEGEAASEQADKAAAPAEQPPAPAGDTPAARAQATADMRRFSAEFGAANGERWYLAGYSHAQAAELHAEVQRLNAQAAHQAGSAKTPLSGGDGANASGPPAKLENALGKKLGSYASTLKVAGRKSDN